MQKVNSVRDRCVILTGDLNLDDEEYQASDWKNGFIKGDQFKDHFTWGGDQFCATLVGDKKVSGPLNLDHTMYKKETAQSIETTLVKTGYEPSRFKLEALSDHEGLLSVVHV